jgi:hypothetical protein
VAEASGRLGQAVNVTVEEGTASTTGREAARPVANGASVSTSSETAPVAELPAASSTVSRIE